MAFPNSKEIAAAAVICALDYDPEAMKLTPEARRNVVLQRVRDDLDELQADILEVCANLCPAE